MSLVGKTVTFWATTTTPQPAMIVEAADPDAVALRIFGSDPTGDYVTYGIGQATEPTENCWTEPGTD